MSFPAPPVGHSARATRALQKLAETDPAFAALSLWVDHRDADQGAPLEPGLEGDAAEAPAWTDGRTIFYGPGFAALDLPRQIGIAAHQILHVALRHPARDHALRLRVGPRIDGRLFNIAADALVNDTLLAAGYILPRPCLTLAPLLQRALGETVTSAAALAKWDAEALTLALANAPTRTGQNADGAGNAPGQGGEAMKAAREAAFTPDIEASEARAGGEAQAAAEETEWRQRLSRALEEGRMAGRGIGALGFRIADLPRSDVPWERHLRALAAKALQDDPHPVWARPARRWVGMEADARGRGAPVPVYQPGVQRSRAVPRLAVGLDSSSSIDIARLEMFLGQVAGIARRGGGEVHLLVFDEVVRSTTQMLPGGEAAMLRRLRLSRDGGTDYADLFAAASALDPAMLIVLTDLDAPVPRPPRGLPLLWAVPELPREVPRHGRVLSLAL